MQGNNIPISRDTKMYKIFSDSTNNEAMLLKCKLRYTKKQRVMSNFHYMFTFSQMHLKYDI